MEFEKLIENATNEVSKNNYDLALPLFLQANKIQANNKKLLYNIAVCYLKIEENDLAIDYLREALSFDREYINAHTNIAIAYRRKEEYAKSLYHLEFSYKALPNDTDIMYNLANTYSSLEDYDKAINLYKKIIALEPNNHKAFYGIGLIYNYLLELDTAKKYFIKTLQLYNGYADAIFALSLIELRQKDYINGWIHYESRWEASNPLKKLKYAVKTYNGEDLTNKNILVQEEQGFGDNIQLIRYIERIKEKNPKQIYVAVRKALFDVFQKIEGITVVGDQEVLYGIDYVLSLHSAPRIFKTTFETIPNTFPYLPTINEPLDDELKKLFNTKKLKVGFAHLGNPEQKNSYYKSVPMGLFKQLFSNKEIDFYSLQVDPKTKNMNQLTKEYDNLFDITPYINSFYDTANIFNHLDVIIAIDSALSHFAGAYNKPTLLLAPQNYDWRWVNNDGISPWYNSVKVIEQKKLGIWNDVIEECASLLKAHTKV